jgi:ArsR family transcriptional regulator
VQDAARFFKVLADDTRLQVLWLLFNHRELCVCDLLAALDVTQSKVSRHLATLRHAGLVRDRKDGLWSYYALQPVADPLAAAQLASLRAQLARRPEARALLQRLHAWLATKQRGASCVPDGACEPAPRAAARRPTRRQPTTKEKR